MQLAIEKACSEAFTKTSYNEAPKELLGVHEGYTHFSQFPLSDQRGRVAKEANKMRFTTKRTENYDKVMWPRTRGPNIPRALDESELDIYSMYLRISKEPEFAF